MRRAEACGDVKKNLGPHGEKLSSFEIFAAFSQRTVTLN
jgi:hypothetical protein